MEEFEYPMLQAVFSDAKDITSELQATDTLEIMHDSGMLEQHIFEDFPNTPEDILGSSYHPGWLEAIDKTYAQNTKDENERYTSQLIDQDHQAVYDIYIHKFGLLDALGQWWGINHYYDAGSRIQTARALINKWNSVPQKGYLGGETEVPTAAVLVTDDGRPYNKMNTISDLLITASNRGNIRRQILGLDSNDLEGVQDFLRSLNDPSITRETHIQQAIQRQQKQNHDRKHHQSR